MKKIEAGDDVPSKVVNRVGSQLAAGADTITVPDGYTYEFTTGDDVMDVRLIIKKDHG
jgi:hypothetical protein